MPLYEYACKKCHHRFERIRKFSDRAIKKCPQCGGPVEQTISAPAVQFKGSGWYVTDYAKKSGSAGDSSAKETGAKDSAAKDSGAKDSGGDRSSKESASSQSRAKQESKTKSDTSSSKKSPSSSDKNS
jgi:putative FmdB family regulatory protein